MQIYSVVVTYNAERYLDGCISGLINSDIENAVIVVDNASTDSTVDKIKKNYPEVILIDQEENLGFGRANNLGIEYALNEKADYVFLLNQDAVVEKNTISTLANCFQYVDESYGIISPLQMNSFGSDLDFQWKDYYLTESTCPSYFTDLQSKTVKGVYELGFANAAAWMVSKECLQNVGGFNRFFFMYAEDLDYINRLHFKGLKLGVCPGSKIRHLREKQVAKEKNNSTKFFIRKYYILAAVFIMDPHNKMLPAYFCSAKSSYKSAVLSVGRAKFREAIFHFFMPWKLLIDWRNLKKNRRESLSAMNGHLFN